RDLHLLSRRQRQMCIRDRYFAGAFSGVILSIMPILMLRSARRNGDFEPAWKCGWIAHPAIQAVIVTIYLASAAYAICSAMNLLPAGW
ncbi:hypothetical protein FA455_10645, partial [Pseudomonas aeruginosa]|nr:hypothetical protein [Pseudomonas aeruginosa]